jgi:hypothetical protein
VAEGPEDALIAGIKAWQAGIIIVLEKKGPRASRLPKANKIWSQSSQQIRKNGTFTMALALENQAFPGD